jgi:hypothetical protein
MITALQILTAPMRVKPCPIIMAQRRPKMSLSLPAMEKDTEEAIDQPPMIQVTLETSPRSVAMLTMMPDTTTKPGPKGATNDSIKNCGKVKS